MSTESETTPPTKPDRPAIGSPGVISGNLVQVPVHVPLKTGKNTVNVIGLLNPSFGDVDVEE